MGKCLTGVKILYTTLVVAALIGVIIAAYIMKGKWNIFSLDFAHVGVYGIVIFTFLIVQQIFSILNNNYWIPKVVSKANSKGRAGIQVVGYR
jgi:hypothetical protein